MPHFLRPAILTVCFSVLGPCHAQTPTWVWGVSLGSSDNEFVDAIASDAAGNVYACGNFEENFDFDPGPGFITFTPVGEDAFILKLDDTGALVWAKTIAGTVHQFAQAIAVDPAGNVYVAGQVGPTVADMDPGPGTFNMTSVGGYDLFVLKLDDAGDFVWAKAMGGSSNEEPATMKVDADGHVYVGGKFLSTDADFDPGPGTHTLASNFAWDAFVLELDTDGNFVWANSMGADGNFTEETLDLAVDDAGNVFATGVFADTVDFDPGPGVVNIAAVQYEDAFITKFSTVGDLVWARVVGGGGTQRADGMALDANANILLTGRYGTGLIPTDLDPNAGVVTAFGNPADMFVLKLDSASNFQWVRTFGGPTFQYTLGHAIQVDDDGNSYVLGAFDGTVDFDPGTDTLDLSAAGGLDAMVLKLDASGTFQWATTMQGGAAETPTAMALGNTGSLYVSVDYNSEDLTLGGITVNNAGGTSGTTDMLIARLDSTSMPMGLIAMAPTSAEALAYPVPFDAHLLVRGCAANDELRLLDMSGRCVLRERAQGVTTALNTDALTSGVYLLEVCRGKAMLRSKVVKE